jgi:hypothetical protein
LFFKIPEKLAVFLCMARSRIMLYSFFEAEGKVKLHINLGQYLVDACNHHSDTLQINLPSGLITLKKAEYLNTGKVYFNGKVFFIVATKYMGKKQALKFLLAFAVERSEQRLNTYKKLLVA